MSITNYSELKTAVASWLKRTDLTAQIPDFIALAETKMGEDLLGNGTTLIATMTAVVADMFVDLPTDFRNLRSIAITADSSLIPLNYVTPQQLASFYNIEAPGRPTVYTVVGRQIRFAMVPDVSYPVEIVYERHVPPLTDAAPTNWLLERSPNAYLFGALLMAQPYMLKDDRIGTFQAMYADAVSGINLNDWHVGGELIVRPDVRAV